MTLCKIKEAKAFEIAKGIVKRDGPFAFEHLSGGLSGTLLVKVSAPNQSCVVRFWNMQWASCFPQDLLCQQVASDAGYGPKVLFSDPEAYMSAIEYIQHEHLPDIQTRLKALVDLAKKIHTGPLVPSGFDKAFEVGVLIDDVAALKPQFLDMGFIKEVKEAVFEATRPRAKSVTCHRDLHAGNLLCSQGRYYAIDYTWAGIDDPFSDLATLAIFNCMDLEEEKLLLELYCGYKPEPLDVAHLTLLKQAYKMFYGLEFLKLSPKECFTRKHLPKVEDKAYLKFGAHGQAPPTPESLLHYAASLFGEILSYAQSDQFKKDLSLLKTNH